MPLGPDNPHGVGFVAMETEFATEREAIRCVDPARSRVWKIKNPRSLNPVSGAPQRCTRLAAFSLMCCSRMSPAQCISRHPVGTLVPSRCCFPLPGFFSCIMWFCCLEFRICCKLSFKPHVQMPLKGELLVHECPVGVCGGNVGVPCV